MSERTVEDVAQELFGEQYHRLSAWGQLKCDQALRISERQTALQGSLPEEPEAATLRQENERLSRKLESAQQENLDLWMEVTELRTELTDLRVELNLPESSS